MKDCSIITVFHSVHTKQFDIEIFFISPSNQLQFRNHVKSHQNIRIPIYFYIGVSLKKRIGNPTNFQGYQIDNNSKYYYHQNIFLEFRWFLGSKDYWCLYGFEFKPQNTPFVITYPYILELFFLTRIQEKVAIKLFELIFLKFSHR